MGVITPCMGGFRSCSDSLCRLAVAEVGAGFVRVNA